MKKIFSIITAFVMFSPGVQAQKSANDCEVELDAKYGENNYPRDHVAKCLLDAIDSPEAQAIRKQRANEEKKQIADEEKRRSAKQAKILEDRRNRGGVTIGMSASQVVASSWGKPRDINRTTTSRGVREQWVYSSQNYLYFENGVLTAIQN